MKVLIVGGGIAGMALGALLKQKGINAVIVDTAPEWRHIGFGLYLWHNGRTVVDELGIGHHLLGREYMLPRACIHDGRGKALLDVPFSYFGSYRPISIHRADLHAGLCEAVAGLEVRFKTSITALTQTADAVTATFTDGSREEYDVVIGGDGIHSHVREYVSGPTTVWPYHWSAWLFWVNGESPLATDGVESFIAPGQVLGVLPLKDSHFVMLNTVIAPGTPDPVETRRERFHAYTSRFGQPVHDLIDRIEDMSTVFHTDLMYVPMGAWHKGRIALMGDARHAISPIGGMGANMALEDASVLAEEITRTGAPADIPAALDRYAARRTKRVNRIRETLRAVERVGLIRSPLLAKARDRAIGVFPLQHYIMRPLRRILQAGF